jgi:hypothetical protein
MASLDTTVTVIDAAAPRACWRARASDRSPPHLSPAGVVRNALCGLSFGSTAGRGWRVVSVVSGKPFGLAQCAQDEGFAKCSFTSMTSGQCSLSS